MKVYKFGGASVKDAQSVRNVAQIIQHSDDDQLSLVISAMGKTTNDLEGVLLHYLAGEKELMEEKLDLCIEFHEQIIQQLFSNPEDQLQRFRLLEDELKHELKKPLKENADFHYDQIVSFGEIWSTQIVSWYLLQEGIEGAWADARKLILTDDIYREAKVLWDSTEKAIQSKRKQVKGVLVTQGFIGRNKKGYTTTLGREGSDFSAAILAYCLKAESLTIWKDVEGLYNADPRKYENTVLIPKVSYKEAIELSYFGASVVHPKTIKPLQNKHIPLHIRSFYEPDIQGTVIQSDEEDDANIASYIFKEQQTLISIIPRDHSFIVEEHLEHIFGLFHQHRVRVNLMQNSAVSFSVCVDVSKRVDKLITVLKENYLVKYNDNLKLLTIRHFDDETVQKLTTGSKILLEQKTRRTARFVLSI